MSLSTEKVSLCDEIGVDDRLDNGAGFQLATLGESSRSAERDETDFEGRLYDGAGEAGRYVGCVTESLWTEKVSLCDEVGVDDRLDNGDGFQLATLAESSRSAERDETDFGG